MNQKLVGAAFSRDLADLSSRLEAAPTVELPKMSKIIKSDGFDFIPHSRPTLGTEEIKAVSEVIASGHIAEGA
ncbi:MAG: hypothetical protein JRE36_14965, partial [Deltaproteobacteria bacterium]|nr:hypothetical protein [Deltaproteobacteria bacterium]